MVTSANTSYVASGIEQTEVEMKTPFQVPLALCSYVDLDAWGDWAIFDPDDEENTHKTIASFVLFLLEVYKQEDLAGQELWSRFRSDFEGWTTATFRKAVSAILKLLRDFLLYRGVWIPIDNSQIRNNLLRVVQENDYHVWTEEEIQDTSKRSPIFRTLALNSNFVEDLQAQPLTVEDIRRQQAALHQMKAPDDDLFERPLPSADNSKQFTLWPCWYANRRYDRAN